MLESILVIIDEHRQYRKQIFKLAKSDLVKTYRGAALGWGWAIIKPVVTLFVYWFAMSVGLRAGGPKAGYPYFLWLEAGFLPWFYMQEMITGGAACIRLYRHLVTRMKFPLSVIPTYYNLSHLYVHLALFGVTIVLFAAKGYPPDIYLLQLPLYCLMMFMFFTTWSLLAGQLSAISRDFQNLVRSFSTALFWLSGIMYDVNGVQNHYIRSILKFNPITIIANGYRNTFIYKTWFFEDMTELRNFVIVYAVFLVLAIRTFKRLRKEIPDVL